MAQLPDGMPIGRIGFDTQDIIGAGGWVTRLGAADDGTMVCGSDVCGPRIRAAGERKWRKLFRPGINIAAAAVPPAHGQPGTWDVAICATDSKVAYWVTGHALWKTTDGGTTAQATGLADIPAAEPNENTRMLGKPIAIDPVNPEVVFVGTPACLMYSANGGASFSCVNTAIIPAPVDKSGHHARYIVCFDRTSAVVGGRTQGIYVFVPQTAGSGLYHSVDGGSTWVNVAGGSATAAHMRVSPHDGHVHLAGDGLNGGASAQYRRWDGKTWLAPSGVAGKSIAISPHRAGHIYMANAGGALALSTDNGATWTPFHAPRRKANDIAWHEWCNEGYMSNGDIEFDGSRNRLWCSEGIGTWYVDAPLAASAETVEWLEASAGIENMVSNIMECDPHGRLLYACQDRRGFAIDRDDIGKRYPPIHALGPGPAIAHGGNMTYAPGDPNVLFMPVYTNAGGKSLNGGASWTVMPGDERKVSGGAGGGNIAALSAQVIIQRETNNGRIMWSKDGGATWQKLIVGGDYPHYGSHHAYWAAHHPLVADRHVANQAFLYTVGSGKGDAEDRSYRGIWRINYDPAEQTMTTTRVKGPAEPYIIGYGPDYWHGHFAQIGVDDWLWCGGDGALGLWRSSDGMANWKQMRGTDDVHRHAAYFCQTYAVCVGAGRTPGSKTILACGFRAASPVYDHATWDDYGFWLSEDLGATWTRIEQLIDGCTAPSQGLAADPEIYGLFYVGLGSSEGVARIRYQDRRRLS
jgi:hypothetical protein